MTQARELLEPWLNQAQEQLQRLPYASLVFPAPPQPVETTQPAGYWFPGKPDSMRLEDIPQAVWLALWPLALLVIYFYLKGEDDQPIRYRLPSPKMPEREEILSSPTIKVRTSNDHGLGCLHPITDVASERLGIRI